jgi:hypothetical protein
VAEAVFGGVGLDLRWARARGGGVVALWARRFDGVGGVLLLVFLLLSFLLVFLLIGDRHEDPFLVLTSLEPMIGVVVAWFVRALWLRPLCKLV